jgi:hypothetical protein
LAVDEPTDRELEAEVASMLRRPPDDLERQHLESWIDACEAMALYAKHLVPEDGMECEPRNCRECGQTFTPPRHDAGALHCSKACLHKMLRKEALMALKLERQRNAAEGESQPT